MMTHLLLLCRAGDKKHRVRDFASTLSDLRNIPIEIVPVRGTLTKNLPQPKLSPGAYGIRSKSEN